MRAARSIPATPGVPWTSGCAWKPSFIIKTSHLLPAVFAVSVDEWQKVIFAQSRKTQDYLRLVFQKTKGVARPKVEHRLRMGIGLYVVNPSENLGVL